MTFSRIGLTCHNAAPASHPGGRAPVLDGSPLVPTAGVGRLASGKLAASLAAGRLVTHNVSVAYLSHISEGVTSNNNLTVENQA